MNPSTSLIIGLAVAFIITVLAALWLIKHTWDDDRDWIARFIILVVGIYVSVIDAAYLLGQS